VSAIRTLLVVAFLAPCIVLGTLVGYPVARILGRREMLSRVGRGCARIALRLAGVHVVVEGHDRPDRAPGVLLVSNHASHLDVTVLLGALGVDFIALLKKELCRFPVGGPLRFLGFIPVDRGDPAQSADAMAEAVAALRSGRRLLVFPEGTRSPDGRLREFKRGAFAIAVEAGCRLVPLALEGTHRLMPRGSRAIHPGPVRVRVLQPVEAQAFGPEGAEPLAAEVRSRLLVALGSPASERLQARERAAVAGLDDRAVHPHER
jgi:1-acyl-sn-glycerol-3-phosphate acyltransferase